MPTFETSNIESNKTLSNDKHGYNKIIALFRKNDSDQSLRGKLNRFSIGIKDDASLNDFLLNLPSGEYISVASADLGNIFMPFCTQSGVQTSGIKNMPGISYSNPKNSPSGVDFYKISPFKFNRDDEQFYDDRNYVPSGDTLKGMVSSDLYVGDIDRFRNNADIRGIGFRLPAMGVGWGYSPDGGVAFPSGIQSGGSGLYFKGGYKNGTDVDPSDYIAAPIDFRYDKDKNVWTTERGFWAILSSVKMIPPQIQGAASGFAYSWSAALPNESGALGFFPNPSRTGVFNLFEVNNLLVNTGYKAWIMPMDNYGHYQFKYDVPIGQGKYKVFMIGDDSNPGSFFYDYLRFS